VLTLGILLLFFQSLSFFLAGHCTGRSFLTHKIFTLHFEVKSKLSVLTVAVKDL